MNWFSKRLAQSSLIVFMVGSVAQAADLTRAPNLAPALYVAVSGGWNHLNSSDLSVPAATSTGEIFFNDGWTGAVQFGGHLDKHVRAEIELAAHQNWLNYENLSGIGRIDLGGGVQVFDGLAKLAYDFGDGPFRPYVAAGIGLANFSVNLQSPVTGNDNKWVMAGALEAGINYAVSPHAELFAAGQVLMLGDVTIDPTSTGGATLSHPTLFSTSVGIRWNF